MLLSSVSLFVNFSSLHPPFYFLLYLIIVCVCVLECCHGHERKSRENVRKLEDGEIAISDENEGKGRGGGR